MRGHNPRIPCLISSALVNLRDKISKVQFDFAKVSNDHYKKYHVNIRLERPSRRRHSSNAIGYEGLRMPSTMPGLFWTKLSENEEGRELG
jgi:hypothetical protein